MAKTTTKRKVKPWTPAEEKLMKQLVKAGTPTAQIARQLKRSPASIRSKAQKAAISLKPRAARRR